MAWWQEWLVGVAVLVAFGVLTAAATWAVKSYRRFVSMDTTLTALRADFRRSRSRVKRRLAEHGQRIERLESTPHPAT